jgi:hypothetical protein
MVLGKLGGAIMGGISSRKHMRRARQMLQEQKNKNQNWYDRRINEDGTQKADAQRLLELTRKGIEDRNKRAAEVSAVMGGDQAAVAAAQQRNNEAIADTMSGINAQAEANKSAIEQQYMARDAELTGQQYNNEVQRAQQSAATWKAAGDAISEAGEQLAGAMSGGMLGGGATTKKAGSILGMFMGGGE